MSKLYSAAGKNFDNIQDAVIHARECAKKSHPRGLPAVAVIDQTLLVVIAVVTDDANGLTVHRLNTWPDNVDCAY